MIVAKIRESDCIGCTKCIDVCPTDAILGSDNFMHTVINDECIGCKLCLPACPVDCIELITQTDKARIPPEHVKMRYQQRKERLAALAAEPIPLTAIDIRKQYIQAALARRLQSKR